MIVTTTPMSVQESLDCVAQILGEQGGRVLARINLGKSAFTMPNAGQIELLMFEKSGGWAFLMDENPAIGIEWPLKILAWQDEQGTTRVGYTKPAVLLARYKLKQKEFSIENIENLMTRITADFSGDSPYGFADR
jgi:uncharacterized protein (DUF302 family)